MFTIHQVDQVVLPTFIYWIAIYMVDGANPLFEKLGPGNYYLMGSAVGFVNTYPPMWFI